MDSSALVKIYIGEPGSVWIREIYEEAKAYEILISEIAGAEVFAALHRRFRNRDLAQDNLRTACALFQKDFDDFYTRLPVVKATVDFGMRLIQKYPLRGYDSIQLATALSFLEELRQLDGELLDFVGADKLLNTCAVGEGLTVINPSEYE